jgi:hypothetical protein
MSQFINVQMLAALGLGKSRKAPSGRSRTPAPPPSAPRMDDVAAVANEEPGSSSRIRIARGYALS